jgi:asparagine synthase (glutamine-hydrolysing)
MCGIVGVLGYGAAPPSLEQLGAMASVLHHRGPDEQGLFRDACCGLGHARLSIIDLASGQQPMLGGGDAGDADDAQDAQDACVLTYNGEVYNYRELREELVALGHRFRTQSDTEVVLQAWRAWGVSALARFNGQFAFALWDRRARTLVLARDRFGVRPLYVCAHGGRVFFASEVKAIFAADAAIPRELDPAGLAETFTFWTTVAPRTVFRGVEELRPGHVRIYTPEGSTETCYWRPRYPIDGDGEFRGSVEEASEELRGRLARATSLRMLRADVDVGSYLSGGLDSSLVAALARRAIGGRLRTFSLRFTDAEYDETSFQREMVQRLGSEHAEILVSRGDIAAAFPETIRHVERPILRTAPTPLLLLARLVRDRGIKVVVTGEGADEMLAGYDLFREARVRRFWARQPHSKTRPLLLDKLYPYLARSSPRTRAMAREFFGKGLAGAHAPEFAHLPRWRSAQALQRLFSPSQRAAIAASGDPIADLLATLPAELPRWNPLARDQYLEVRTLMSGYLLSAQGDRVAMASSVEGRFPFLDPDVVELSNALPAEYKLRVLDEKHVLKRAAAELLPASITRRSKQPYRAPDGLSFLPSPRAAGEAAPDWVREALDPRAIAACGVFDAGAVAHLWAKALAASAADASQLSNADDMAIVGVLSTQLLHRELVQTQPSARTRVPTTVIDRLA